MGHSAMIVKPGDQSLRVLGNNQQQILMANHTSQYAIHSNKGYQTNLSATNTKVPSMSLVQAVMGGANTTTHGELQTALGIT